jgi:hypothetical protein
MHPRKPARRMRAFALGLTLAFAANVQAFDPGIHERLTEAELKSLGFDANSADEVGDSNFYTDQFESSNEAAHADNNNLGGASARLRSKREDIVGALAVCNRRSALDRLGEALHTVQDVYSHSNSVDNGIAINDLLGMVNGSAACSTPGFAPGGLVSGYFSVSGWFLRDQCRGMPAGMCCHLHLNKDNPGKLNGARHPAALAAARGGTQTYYGLVEQLIHQRYSADRAAQMISQLKRDQRSTFFVIDTTGSMGPDLAGIKATVNGYIDSVVAAGEVPQLGLVTFKDNVSDRGTMCDLELLRAQINSLSASGGGDCPEASNSALVAALSHFPQSTTDLQAMGGRIMLATDASARDNDKGSQVRFLANDRRVSIDAILTGDCAAEGSSVVAPMADSVAYSDNQDGTLGIAAAAAPAASGDPLNSRSARTQLRALTELTGGVLFNVNRGEVDDVSGVLLELGRPEVAVILSQKVAAGAPVTVELPVDDTLEEKVTFMVTASTSAALPTVRFRRPDGTLLAAGDAGVTYRRLSSVMSFEVLNPTVGVWTAEFTGDGTGVLRAFGPTSLQLNSVRLMAEGGRGLDHAEALEPLIGEPVIGDVLAARLRFTEAPEDVAVNLRAPTGQTLATLAAPTALDGRQFLAELTVPVDPFVVEATGLTSAGHRFVRQVAVPSIPQTIAARFEPAMLLASTGTSTPLSLKLHNRGGSEARYGLTFGSDLGWNVSGPADVVIPAGAERTVALSVSVPASASQDDQARVRVDVRDLAQGNSHNYAVADVIAQSNLPPVCDAASATPAVIWPPNHELIPIRIEGVTDPDGDTVSLKVTSITQDEPVNSNGSGSTSPDATGVATDRPAVRSERDGGGDGRVYQLTFTAEDSRGAACSGRVNVDVLHREGRAAVDSGQRYDSTGG